MYQSSVLSSCTLPDSRAFISSMKSAMPSGSKFWWSAGWKFMSNSTVPSRAVISSPLWDNADSIYGEDGGMRTTDLDRDGVEERVQICDIVADGRAVGQRVELWEGENLLFSEEGYFVHPGYNALFLCKEYGRDTALRKPTDPISAWIQRGVAVLLSPSPVKMR